MAVMDCIDCHNRPTHIYYYSPVDAVNLALYTGRIDRTIPGVKQQAVQALTKNYGTDADAKRGIAETLMAFYRSKYAGFAKSRQRRCRSIVDLERHFHANGTHIIPQGPCEVTGAKGPA